MSEKTILEWFENWMDKDMNIAVVDLTLEFLDDQGMLTESGKKFYQDFLNKRIRMVKP